jgi:hypothetical protein
MHTKFWWGNQLENCHFEDEEIKLVITLRLKENKTLNNHHCENLKSWSITMDLRKIVYDDGM